MKTKKISYRIRMCFLHTGIIWIKNSGLFWFCPPEPKNVTTKSLDGIRILFLFFEMCLKGNFRRFPLNTGWHFMPHFMHPYCAANYLAEFFNCWNNTIMGRLRQFCYKNMCPEESAARSQQVWLLEKLLFNIELLVFLHSLYSFVMASNDLH